MINKKGWKRQDKTMDLRVMKTERSIRNAFLELRSKQPLEQIKVKDLCDIACINKSTFYAHYRDIYDLSDAVETETVREILNSISFNGNILDGTVDFTKSLCIAFLSQSAITDILFSGSERSRFVDKIEHAVLSYIQERNPGFCDNALNRLLLSYTTHGSYKVMMAHSDLPPAKRIELVERVMLSISPLFEV